jgi:hypothetical protein
VRQVLLGLPQLALALGQVDVLRRQGDGVFDGHPLATRGQLAQGVLLVQAPVGEGAVLLLVFAALVLERGGRRARHLGGGHLLEFAVVVGAHALPRRTGTGGDGEGQDEEDEARAAHGGLLQGGWATHDTKRAPSPGSC